MVSAKPPFRTITVLETGPITNHVTFISNRKGRFAYISVGGRDQVLVYRRDGLPLPKLIATVKTGDLPHGLWGSGDGNRVYVGLENGDAVQAIDTDTNQVVATVPVGQLPQALVYVSHAATSGRDISNLRPPGLPMDALHIELVPPPGASSEAHASVAVNSLGLIDNLQLAATGLEPGRKYKLVIVGGSAPQDLAVFAAGIGGVAIVQTLGPLKRVIAGSSEVTARTLEVRSDESGADSPVLRQAAPPRTR